MRTVRPDKRGKELKGKAGRKKSLNSEVQAEVDGRKREICKQKKKQTRTSRLYLGMPRCGGWVWTLFCRGEAGLGTSRKGDPMLAPRWHNIMFSCTRCLWAGLGTSGYSQRQSTAQCGNLESEIGVWDLPNLGIHFNCSFKVLTQFYEILWNICEMLWKKSTKKNNHVHLVFTVGFMADGLKSYSD